ncbi:conjugal transfer protein TraF [Enterococcus sp. AZ007]|uniref:conjugal transfer protein TraF n=1 Tax=Enterococcus sp. AZ007 TaxID=2774839 RepID=UPI003F1FFA49
MEKLTAIEDFRHGDIIKVISHERNCGIDETTFLATVINTAEWGLIALPHDVLGHFYNSAEKGSVWETEISWLLDNDVEIFLFERYENLLRNIWHPKGIKIWTDDGNLE